MIYNIKAIPTVYNHVQFRSRLEARWAAFFDLAGIKWDYEPFDLEGWAPDFMLKGKTKALVEVKPIDFSAIEASVYRQARAQAAKAYRIADMSEPPHAYEIMVIGNGPFVNEGVWSLGTMPLERELSSEDVAELFFGRSGQRLDYAARYGSYEYRMGGEYAGDHHLLPIHDLTPQDLWRQAGSIVQWKAPEADDYHSQLRRIFKRRAA